MLRGSFKKTAAPSATPGCRAAALVSPDSASCAACNAARGAARGATARGGRLDAAARRVWRQWEMDEQVEYPVKPGLLHP